MTKHNRSFYIISLIIGVILLYNLIGLFVFVGSHRFDIMLNLHILRSILVPIAGLLGIGIFLSTRFRNTTLLEVFMCYNVFLFPFILLKLKASYDRASSHGTDLFRQWHFSFGILVSMLLITTCCIGLWKLSRRRQPTLAYVTIGDESFAEFSPAPAHLRFFNRLADVMIIYTVLYFDIKDNYFFRDTFRNSGSGMLIIIEFIASFYYYIVLEGIFNCSIGKYLTGTMIVDEHGRKPSFAKILGRTLCRYIPFEAFSFFGKNPRGWHDSMSGTFVVKVDNTPELQGQS